MALNEEQDRVLRHARAVLAEERRAGSQMLPDEWFRAFRQALADVVAAFETDIRDTP